MPGTSSQKTASRFRSGRLAWPLLFLAVLVITSGAWAQEAVSVEAVATVWVQAADEKNLEEYIQVRQQMMEHFEAQPGILWWESFKGAENPLRFKDRIAFVSEVNYRDAVETLPPELLENFQELLEQMEFWGVSRSN